MIYVFFNENSEYDIGNCWLDFLVYHICLFLGVLSVTISVQKLDACCRFGYKHRYCTHSILDGALEGNLINMQMRFIRQNRQQQHNMKRT